MGEKNIYFNEKIIKFFKDEEIEFSIIFNDSYDDVLKKPVFYIKNIVFTRHNFHLSYDMYDFLHFPTENDLIDDIRNRFKIFDPVNFQKGE